MYLPMRYIPLVFFLCILLSSSSAAEAATSQQQLHCNCYPYSVNCNTSVEVCQLKYEHCYMMVNYDNVSKVIISGCHVFSEQECPKSNTSEMYITWSRKQLKYKYFCCNGNFCNTVENLLQTMPNNTDEIVEEDPESEDITTQPVRSQNHLKTIVNEHELIVIIIACLSGFIAFLIIGLIVYLLKEKCASRYSALSFLTDCTQLPKANNGDIPQYHRNNNQSTARCTNNIEFGNIITPTRNPNEIESIASLCEKVELKAHGRFGSVWLVNLRRPPSTATSGDADAAEIILPSLAAAKIFPQVDEMSWKSEVDIYRLPGMNHENVLTFIGADQVETRDLQKEFWLVTEYHCNGSVYDYLQSKSMTWLQMIRIGTDMARGLSYLHEEVIIAPSNSNCDEPARWDRKPSIAHRDFKSRNVLLKSNLRACIADLGLSIRFVAGQCLGNFQLQVGTRRYMAPEVLEGAIQFSRDSFLRIDVYAMGLVLWELMSRTRADTAPGIDNSQVPADEPAPYTAPFEIELGPHPDKDQMCTAVTKQKLRPKPLPYWIENKVISFIWDTVEECWDSDAEARLSAGCVAERLENQYDVLSSSAIDDDIQTFDAASVSVPLLGNLKETSSVIVT